MSTSTTESPDVATLAWEGDRLSVHDLDENTQRLLDGIASYLFTIWPHDDVIADKVDESALEQAKGELEDDLAAEIGPVLGEGNVTQALQQEGKLRELLEHALTEARGEGLKDATVPSRANTAERKAMRLLLERRIEITRYDIAGQHAGLIVARCKGENGNYQLGYDPHAKRWRCTCPEMRGDCSHLAALKMITTTMEAT